MAQIVKPNTFTSGQIIVAADHNSNFDTIYADYNGNIDNTNVVVGAGITDNKLAQITTALKVSGTAITLLASLSSAAGIIPSANLPAASGSVAADGSVNPTNILRNGDFESWLAGTAVAPDDWAIGGASASVAQGATTPDPKLGTYYAELTRAGTDCILFQIAETDRGIAYWQGRKVTFGCWVYATVAGRACLSVGDGVGTTTSSFHTGGSTWEFLTVTHTVDVAATYVYPTLNIVNGDTTVGFDGATLVEGASAFAFSPKPGLGPWSTARSNNTVYLAATDGFVCSGGVTGVAVSGYSDASNPPTTRRASNTPVSGNPGSITFPVKRGDYWKVVHSGTPEFVYWLPSGS
jgi:hypothetical protein